MLLERLGELSKVAIYEKVLGYLSVNYLSTLS